MTAAKKASGCLFGLAIGDALAAPTEFMSIPQIVARYGEKGPVQPSKRVTDDTQMALAVGEALLSAEALTPQALEPALRKAFVDWSRSPDNNRAPGNTCMQACAALSNPHRPWHEAAVARSKGCGANMRVAPVGLLKDVDPSTRAAIAQFQAALTHGHPTGLVSSDLTAFLVADLAAGGNLKDLLTRVREYASSQRDLYHDAWLGPLWSRDGANSPQKFIRTGWDECLALLPALDRAVETADRRTDPCLATGAGWVAEEAFATGLLCFLLYPDDPVAAIRRAAVTSGDSDSIACLTGAFAGAAYGPDAWPADWVRNIEYHDRLARLAAAWD